MVMDFSPPSLKKDWKWLIIVGLVVYAFACMMKMQEFPRWNHPALMINGEYLLGTHDAYFWVAGVEGVGLAQGTPMAIATKFLSQTLGVSPGLIAFFAPAFVPSLVAVLCLLWGWILGGVPAGILAGLLGSLAPGFFYRTRLGYFDTDLVTLFFPLFISLAVACWLMPHIRSKWIRRKGDPEPLDFSPTTWNMAYILAAGLFSRFGGWWHGDVSNFAIVVFWLGLVLVLVLANKKSKPGLCLGLCVYALAAFAGNLGLVLSVVLAFAVVKRPERIRPYLDDLKYALALIALVAVGAGMIYGPAHTAFEKAMGYLKPVAEDSISAKSGGPVYPSITQSIREAQNIPWNEILTRLAPASWLAVLGMGLFLVVCFFRSYAIFLLPLLALSLLAVKLGARMSMFGAPAVFLGIGVTLHWLGERLLRGFKWRTPVFYLVQVVVALVFFMPWAQAYVNARPTPVLDKYHAKALVDLGKKAKPNSEVWTWWDYGYATQYYAKLMTASDGGRHTGEEIFPTAVALTTGNPGQAAGMIKYCAAQDYDPTKVWDKMPARKVRDMIRSFSGGVPGLPPVPDQYLVVTWENLRLAYWITFYGSWDLIYGSGVHANVALITSQFYLDQKNGAIVLQNPQPARITISSVDILSRKGTRHLDFPKNTGLHIVINETLGQAFAMDNLCYESMMLQLLMHPAASPLVSDNFEVVYDDAPNVRILKVRGD